MEITTTSLKEFRADFKDAVKSLEAKYGMIISLDKITYTDVDFTGKLSVKPQDNPYARLEHNFKTMYNLYGLSEDMLGKTFNIQGKLAKFVGIDTKKRNYPCICTLVDGSGSYKLSEEQLKRKLGV